LGRHETRSLTEGAMLAAITVLLSLLGAYVFPYVFFIVPVPLAILVYRHGLRQGILVAITSSLLAGILIHISTTVILLLVFGLVGVALGAAMGENLSAPRVLLIGVGASLIAYVLLILVSQAFFGVNVMEMLLESFEISADQISRVYEGLGMEPDQIAEAQTMLQEMMAMMKRVLPATFLLSALLLAFLNFWLTRLILGRLGHEIGWFPPFAQWKFPWYTAWGYILGLGLPLVAKGDLAQTIASNLQILFTYFFLIQGLALVWFLLDKYNIVGFMRGFILFLILLPGTAFSVFVIWAGLFDTWFDFRKLERAEN
jgi:uncharacterized protein YybS (DUF2232 family)